MYVFPGRGICRDFFRWTGGISLKGPSPVCNGRQKFAPCLRLPGHRRCTAGKRPCNRRSAPAFCLPPRPCSPAARLPALCMSLRPCPAHTCQVSACPRAKRPCTRTHASSFSMSLRPCPAHACQVSACPRAKRPCNRTHASSFSMSLRTTSLQPRTRPSFCMSLRTSAHTGVAIRSPRRETWQLGNTLGEFAPTLPGCHCEPVRTLVWQSVTPQRNFANWQFLGQIRMHFPVFALGTALCYALPQGCGLPRRFAPRNDSGGRPLHPRTPARPLHVIASLPRARLPSFRMSSRQTSLHPRTPARPLHVIASLPRTHLPVFSMSLRATFLQPHTRLFLQHVIANQCAHWCGNPRPRRETLQIGNP